MEALDEYETGEDISEGQLVVLDESGTKVIRLNNSMHMALCPGVATMNAKKGERVQVRPLKPNEIPTFEVK